MRTRVRVDVHGFDWRLHDSPLGVRSRQQGVELPLETVPGNVEQAFELAGSVSAEPRLGVGDLYSRRQPEELRAHRIAETRPGRHVAREGPHSQHQRLRIAARLPGDRGDVGGSVLAVRIGADDLLAGRVFEAPAEGGSQRVALPAVSGVSDDPRAVVPRLLEDGAVAGAGPVIDHEDLRVRELSADVADEVGEPAVGFERGNDDDHDSFST